MRVGLRIEDRVFESERVFLHPLYPLASWWHIEGGREKEREGRERERKREGVAGTQIETGERKQLPAEALLCLKEEQSYKQNSLF